MPLEPVALDDLTWDQMVASVRGRIPGASAGTWTHHAAVDPGVTLLELYAWLIEQRLYWIDQVPDELLRALLSLLDVAPRPARPAATVLALADRADRGFIDLPAATEMVLEGDPRRTFSTRHRLAFVPLARLELHTAAGEVSAELAGGRPVPLLSAEVGPSAARIVLWLRDALPATRPVGELALLFDLAAADGIEPGWSPDAPEGVASPAELEWLVDGAGGAVALPADSVADGTGGLRRSGVVRLPLLDAWQPAGPPDVGGAVPYAITLRTARASFTSPPVLTRLAVNAVVADHRKAVAMAAGDLAGSARNWLKLPGQTLELEADEPRPLAPTVTLELREAGGLEEWRPVADFAFHGPDARVFRVDRERRTLSFGDGLSGRVPVPHDRSAPELEVAYLAGGGAEGNLGAVREQRWRSPADGDLVASSPVPAAGGADPETPGLAARRAAAELEVRHRAVTRADFEELAIKPRRALADGRLAAPGVAIARAYAAVGHHPLHPCAAVPGAVTVFVVPWAPRPEPGAAWKADATLVRAPVADPGALAEVRRQLDRARLVTAEVFVAGARYRAVSLAVRLAGSFADPAALEHRLAGALGRFLDPLAGGEAGVGWPFGESLRPSALLRRAERALAREGEVLSVAVGLDGETPHEECRDLPIGAYELVYLAELTLRFEPSTAAGGLP